jgi:hypothetical protein
MTDGNQTPEVERLCWIQLSQQCDVTGSACAERCSCLERSATKDAHSRDPGRGAAAAPYLRAVGRRTYGVCGDCGKIVWANKPLIGSTHICTTEEERSLLSRQIRARAEASLRELQGMNGAAS